MGCEQEMCENWTGDAACACALFQIEPEDRPIFSDSDGSRWDR